MCKRAGNEAYKAGRYDEAIRCYSEAIGVNRRQPVYWSNRSACHQAKGSWAPALADARECLGLEVSFLKGYLHCVKCQLQLGQHAEAAATLRSAPLELRSHSELLALDATVQEAVDAILAAMPNGGSVFSSIFGYTNAKCARSASGPDHRARGAHLPRPTATTLYCDVDIF